LAWHIVLEAIKNSTILNKTDKTALVVDSDLSIWSHTIIEHPVTS
jgi:hypothetical protein